MPDLSTFVAFYLAVLALQLTPGPDMMLVIGRGLGQGPKTAMLAATGATLVAAAIQLPLLALGVASVFAASPLAFDILRLAGAAYLIWIGVKMVLGARRSEPAAHASTTISSFRALFDGAVSNLANPKVLVFMLAFLPQFVDAGSSWSVGMQLLFLGSVQKISGFLVLSSVACSVGSLGSWLSRRPGLIVWQERLAGLVMLGLGLRLAFLGEARPSR